MARNPVRFFVLMGVAASGKSSYAAMLADRMDATYIDGDDYHPPANIAKMAAGIPLTDADRWPWLDAVAAQMIIPSGLVFISCSALRKRYREYLTSRAGMPLHFIYLAADRSLIAKRMAARDGHFMPKSLIDSQFAALEVPDDNEAASHIEITSHIDITSHIEIKDDKQAVIDRAVIDRILSAIAPLL